MADRVLVLRAGKVVGFGTHAELMRANSWYEEMYEMQVAGYQNDDTQE